MGILKFISDIFKPASNLIDKLHTSEEEKLALRNELAGLQATINSKLIEYQASLDKSQTEVIRAEIKSGSWLQRSWRPLTMVVFVTLYVLNAFGLLAVPLEGTSLDIIKLGLSGYVGGRSLEKIADKIVPAISKSKE